jgi:hypothetical protein
MPDRHGGQLIHKWEGMIHLFAAVNEDSKYSLG